jgi:hypothetical protein
MYASLLNYPNLAPIASEYSQDAASLVQIIKAMPDGSDKNDLRQAYTDSLHIVLAVCCQLSVSNKCKSNPHPPPPLSTFLTGTQGTKDENFPIEDSMIPVGHGRVKRCSVRAPIKP